MNIDSNATQQILKFWFGELKTAADPIAEEIQKRWFTKDKQFDLKIKQDYLSFWQSLNIENCLAALHSPQTALAHILVLDQFARNMHRGQPQSFEKDGLAQTLALEMTEQKLDQQLYFVQRVFVYMPFMHAEDLKLQNSGLQHFKALVEAAPPQFKKGTMMNLDFMQKHLDIIKRFGRFPHRNEVLGRVSTAEEVEFLTGPNSSF